MQQLTGMDAAFLHMETPATQGHVGSLTIFDAKSAPAGFGFEELNRILEQRLDLAPVLRRRLVEVPFGLDQPYWIEDPDFDSTTTFERSPCRPRVTKVGWPSRWRASTNDRWTVGVRCGSCT